MRQKGMWRKVIQYQILFQNFAVLQIRSKKVSSLKFKLRVKEYTFPFVQLTISSTKENKAKKKLSFK